MQYAAGGFVYLADWSPTAQPVGDDLELSAYRQSSVVLPSATGTPLSSLAEALTRLRRAEEPPARSLPGEEVTPPTAESAVERAGVFLLLVAVGGAMVSTRLWVPLMATTLLGCTVVLALHAWNTRDKTPSVPPPPPPPPPSQPALLYDLDDGTIRARAELAAAIPQMLQQASATWLITAATRVEDTRRNAGAGTTVRRVLAQIHPWAPVPLNVFAGCVQTPETRLVFLPDALLVVTRDATWPIPYEELTVSTDDRLFAEEGPRPHDARQQGTTWRYVCKNGSPDLRFADNAEIPWLEYCDLTLRAKSGWQTTLQVSRPALAHQAAEALRTLARKKQPNQNAVRPAPTVRPPLAGIRPSMPPSIPPPQLARVELFPLMGALSELTRPAQEFIEFVPLPSSPPPPPPPPVPALPRVVVALQSAPDFIDFQEAPAAPIPSAPELAGLDEGIVMGWTLTVLKAVAVADRKFSEEEKVAVRESLRALCRYATESIADGALNERIRRHPADLSALDAALAGLAGCPPAWRQQLVDKAHRIAGADMKITPKEQERLEQIARALHPQGGLR